VFLLRPLIVLWAIFRQRTLERRVNEKLHEVSNCRHRPEIEQLLGKPRYAVSGEVCDPPDRPDSIECYESEGCCIDLWFKNNRLQNTSGFVKPTLWDMVMAGNADQASRDDDPPEALHP